VPPNDAQNGGPASPGQLDGGNEVGTNILLQIAPADGKNEQAVPTLKPAALQPFGEHGAPTFVVGAGRELGDIVTRCIRFKAADLAKIIDGVRCVGSAASHAEDEKAAPTLPQRSQFIHHLLDLAGVELGNDLPGLFEVLLDEFHSVNVGMK